MNDLSFNIIPNSNFTFTYTANTYLLNVQTSKKFFVGKDSLKIAVSNTDGFADTAWFVFESKAIEINKGDTVVSSINFPSGNVAYTSNPYDSTCIFNASTFFAKPKQNTWYTFFWDENSVALSDSFFVKVNGIVIGDTLAPSDSLPTDTNIVDPGFLGSADFKNKKGGVCFRFEDHQLPANWRAINNLFNQYGLKFTLGLNASRLIGDTAAINAIKEIAASGHEIADHTPDHTTAFFNVYSFADTVNFSGQAGVDHINGKRVCLKIDSVNTETYTLEGLLNINGSTVISQSNGEFRNMNGSVYYSNLFFPSLNRVYVYSNLRNLNQNDPDTCTIQTIWGESVNLGIINGISHHRVTQYDISMSNEALMLLVGRTSTLFNQIGIPQPKTFLIPSGNYSMFTRASVKSRIAPLAAYTGGGVFASPSFKCYNEFDANEDKRFGMNAPDFREEINTAESIKGIIADNAAKHHSSFGLSQFSNMLGGMNGYLARLDTLLKWCVQNNISVLPQRDWASILYDSIPDASVIIIPSLNIDLNRNMVPDGFTTPFAVFDTTDGVTFSGGKSYSRNSSGVMATITNLGGVEKGNNTISISTKGFTGDSIRLVVSFPESGQASITLMFAANTADWTEQSRIISIPNNCSRINLSFNLNKRTVPGFVKISGMKMFATQNLRIQNKSKNFVSNSEKLAIKDISKSSNDVLVYPNPMLDELNIQLPKTESFKRVRIYDMNAKLYLHFDEIDSNELKFGTREIPPGLYILECILGNGEVTRQLLVK